MTNFDGELDEILDKFGWACVANGDDGYGLQNEDVSEAKQAITAHFTDKLKNLPEMQMEEVEMEYIRTHTGEILGPMTDDLVTPRLNDLRTAILKSWEDSDAWRQLVTKGVQDGVQDEHKGVVQK